MTRSLLQRLASLAAVVAVACLGVLIVARPWHMRWGSTAAELRMELPGDEYAPSPKYQIQHAVTIHAPPEAVWPWLAQLGHDKGGFYSYAWLENRFGLHIANADRIHAEWQTIEAGDSIFATPLNYLGTGRRFGWRVSRAEPNRVLVLENWGAFVIHPLDGESSRLIVRTRGGQANDLQSVLLAPLGLLVFEPAHFIMQRKMLLEIRKRAERLSTEWSDARPVLDRASFFPFAWLFRGSSRSQRRSIATAKVGWRSVSFTVFRYWRASPSLRRWRTGPC